MRRNPGKTVLGNELPYVDAGLGVLASGPGVYNYFGTHTTGNFLRKF